MMRRGVIAIGFFALVSLLPTKVQAQCKIFTEKNCKSLIVPYSNTGQYNAAVMFEGEEASLAQTFYAGQDYQIRLCSEQTFQNDCYFELFDYKGQKVYSTEKEELDVFEFSVQNTQNLKIRVVVPNHEEEKSLKQNGCVSIVIGFKESSTGEAMIPEDSSDDLH